MAGQTRPVPGKNPVRANGNETHSEYAPTNMSRSGARETAMQYGFRDKFGGIFRRPGSPRCRFHPCKMPARGLSQLEVLLALTVVVVAVTFATPSLGGFVSRARTVAGAGDLASDIARARSEAIQRARPVTLCPSNDATRCLPNRRDWSGGWMVFVNDGADGRLESGRGDVLLISRARGTQCRTINAHRLDANGWLRFLPSGDADVDGSLLFCTACVDSANGRWISLLYSDTVVVEDGEKCS
jgi:Tfp pilus assembly protein FimT